MAMPGTGIEALLEAEEDMKFLREFWHACLSVLFSTAPWQDAESVRTTKATGPCAIGILPEKFAAYQPVDGELVLVCRDICEVFSNPHPVETHWYMLSRQTDGTPGFCDFDRINDATGETTVGRARWAAVCRNCHMSINDTSITLESRLTEEFEWRGDQPFIREVTVQ